MSLINRRTLRHPHHSTHTANTTVKAGDIHNWPPMYDVVLAANAAADSNSASASTRSTIMGGSPRSNNTEGNNHNQQLLSLADMEQPYQGWICWIFGFDS